MQASEATRPRALLACLCPSPCRGVLAWLLSEIDPDNATCAFGLADLGLGMPEMGWIDLEGLAVVRGRLGLPIERYLYFRAEKRSSAYARDTRLAGWIVV